MITVLIVGILAAVAAPLLVRLTNFWRQTAARNDIQRDVRVSLETMNRYLRQAKRSTLQIDQASGQPPWSRVTFTTQKGQGLTFKQSGNQLLMTLSSGTVVTSVLSRQVGYLAFAYPRTDDVSILSISLTMQSATYLGGKKALQLSISKVRLMNE